MVAELDPLAGELSERRGELGCGVEASGAGEQVHEAGTLLRLLDGQFGQSATELALRRELFCGVTWWGLNSEGEQVLAEQLIGIVTPERQRGLHGRARQDGARQGEERRAIRRFDRLRSCRQVTSMIEHALGDVEIIPVAPIQICGVGLEAERLEDRGPVLRASSERDARELTPADEEESDSIALLEVTIGELRRVVDRSVERRLSGSSSCALEGGVHQDPDVIPLFVFLVDDQELASPRGGFPSDALERIPHAVLSELAEFRALTRSLGDSGIGGGAITASAARVGQLDAGPARQDLEHDGAREGEGNREEPGGMNGAEREPVDAVVADAVREHAERDGEGSSRWDLSFFGVHVDVERWSVRDREMPEAHRTQISVAELDLQSQRSEAMGAERTRFSQPQHFEAGRTRARDADPTKSAGEGHPDQERGSDGEREGLHLDHPEPDEAHAHPEQMNGSSCGFESHPEILSEFSVGPSPEWSLGLRERGGERSSPCCSGYEKGSSLCRLAGCCSLGVRKRPRERVRSRGHLFSGDDSADGASLMARAC